jgi:hypothetical protein
MPRSFPHDMLVETYSQRCPGAATDAETYATRDLPRGSRVGARQVWSGTLIHDLERSGRCGLSAVDL